MDLSPRTVHGLNQELSLRDVLRKHGLRLVTIRYSKVPGQNIRQVGVLFAIENTQGFFALGYSNRWKYTSLRVQTVE
jgi:hypothetical protein